jgi:hypothetical protein
MLQEIMNRRNIEKALLQVERNKGAGGVDGMQTDELRDYLNINYQPLCQEMKLNVVCEDTNHSSKMWFVKTQTIAAIKLNVVCEDTNHSSKMWFVKTQTIVAKCGL